MEFCSKKYCATSTAQKMFNSNRRLALILTILSHYVASSYSFQFSNRNRVFHAKTYHDEGSLADHLQTTLHSVGQQKSTPVYTYTKPRTTSLQQSTDANEIGTAPTKIKKTRRKRQRKSTEKVRQRQEQAAARTKKKKPKSIDKVAIQLALRELTAQQQEETNIPKGQQLVPACIHSPTFGPSNELLTIDGHRIMYRNGRVHNGEWIPHADEIDASSTSGRPEPHLYDIHNKILNVTAENNEVVPASHPEMVIDKNGFPWRAQHVLRERGLKRFDMEDTANMYDYSSTMISQDSQQHVESNEMEDIEISSTQSHNPPKIAKIPIPWDGPLTLPKEVRGMTSNKKLRDDSRIGFEPDDERWLIYYSKLATFAAQHGHADVPLDWPGDEALGRWVFKQRVLYRRYVRNNYYQHEVLNRSNSKKTENDKNANTPLTFGRKLISLSPWRIQMLYDVGFSFKIKLSWEDRYAQLAQYFIRYGHTRVPCSDNLRVEEEEFPGLYVWVQSQRMEYYRWINNLPSSMTNEKFKLLDTLNLDMNPLESIWESKIMELRSYREEHGHVRVTKSQNMELATWLIVQRQQYRLFHSDTPWESRLTQERIDTLNELGMDWDPLERRWQTKWKSLKSFYNENGHSNVPKEYPPNPSLSLWVQKQRRHYKDGTLSVDHERQLKDLNFVFNVAQDNFEKGIIKLRDYKAIHGNCRVPSTYLDRELAVFVINQRRQYQKHLKGESSMLKDRRLALEELGFHNDIPQVDSLSNLDRWEDNYNRLADFHAKYGHCDIPKSYEDDEALATFVKVQRMDYKRLQSGQSQRMTPQRLEKLESIDFSWNANDARWMKRYAELKAYRQKYGNCDVPDRYKENLQLGTWVRNQRVQYKKYQNDTKSTLTPQRIQFLEEIGFAWTLQ